MSFTTNEQAAIHRGFDAGNYAASYFSEDLSEAMRITNEGNLAYRTGPIGDLYRGAFMMGFFSSHADHEIPEDCRTEVLAAYVDIRSALMECGIVTRED